MTAFILWVASFISSPGATMALQTAPPATVSFSPTGDCPITSCGLNGTRITGLAVDVSDNVRAITLPSGEWFTLR